MKAGKFLFVFMMITVILTALLVLGVVSYAEQTVYPTMVVDFAEPTVSEGNYTYTATVYLEDFGTLSGVNTVDAEDYSGRKIGDWTLYMAFEDASVFVSKGTATSALETVSPKMMMNYDESVGTLKAVSSIDGSVKNAYPYNGTVSGKIALGTVVFTTNTDKFTVTLSGDIQLGETGKNGGFVDGVSASTYATSNYANMAETNKILIMAVEEPEAPAKPDLATGMAGVWSVRPDGSKRLYLVAGIDSLNYKSVGFEVSVGGGTPMGISTNTVYTSINVTENGVAKTKIPADLGATNNYIFGKGFGYPVAKVGTVIKVKAFALTFEDEKLYSKEFTITLK